MPFVNRRVEPLYVSNTILPNGCSTELENVSNNSLANLVRQLAHIADHATSIFDEICAESRDIYDRSTRLTVRAANLEDILGTLDARAVKVPVSTLCDFKTLRDHYRYRTPVQNNLITPASRSQCIQVQYSQASTDLKDIFEKLKEYHEDEVTVSNLCQSISLSRLNCDTDSSEYDIEFPRDSLEKRRRKPLLPYSKLPSRPRSEGDLLDDYIPPNRGTLPTPEEVMRKNIAQSSVVSVDTSGTGFERMQTFRRSLTAMGRKLEKAKKKRWRRTVSGIPDEVQAELQVESASGDERSTDPESNFEELKTLSLDRRAFRQVKPKESPAGIAVIQPVRTRRRPKSLRLPGPIIFPGLQQWRESHMKHQEKKAQEKLGGRNRHSVALPLQDSVPTPSPSQGYSSSSDIIWPGPPRRRPHSLAIPPGSLPQSQIASLVPLSPAQPSNKTVYVSSYKQVPNAVISSNATTVTINTRTANNSSGDAETGLPINTLQRNFPTTKVRLRNLKSSARKEERQSSSGNWSGTDSARTSMNSDLGNALSYEFLSSTTTSPSDSAVSLSSENLSFPKFNGGLRSLDRKHSRGKSDRPSSLSYASTGDSSSGSSTPTNSPNNVLSGFTQMDTDSWLQSVGAATDRRMPPEAGNVSLVRKSPEGHCEVIFTSDNLSDSSSSSENPASSSAFSDNGSIDLEVYLADINSDYIDSDSTSGHSVDHEGYWTSMHSDCGLPSRRLSKKRRSSLTKEPLSVNLNQGKDPPAVLSKHKRTSLAVAPPCYAQIDQSRRPPPPPIRVESVVTDELSSTPNTPVNQNKAGGHHLLPLILSEDNRSISPSSLTDTASETSTISSDTTTTPTLTPVQTPTDPAMYKLCFSGSSKSLESLDSQLSGIQGSRPASRVDAWTSEVSQNFSTKQQPDILEANRRSKASGNQKQVVSSNSLTSSGSTSVRTAPVQESVATFTTHVIQPSSSVLPAGSKAEPLLLPSPTSSQSSSPTHEGKVKIMNARDRFFGISRAENEDTDSLPQDGGETLEQDSLDRDCVVSPLGVYPENYNTLKRRPRHETEALVKQNLDQALDHSSSTPLSVSEEQLNEQSERLTVAAKKGLDTLQRKQRFQGYVSSVQNQAPQNYNAINSVKDPVVGNGSQAMTREQREEILNMMRKSKNNKAASCSSPTLTEPSSKGPEDHQRHELTKINENVVFPDQTGQQQKLIEDMDKETSFRNSYHLGIEADNLDPDLAIIRAAEEMERQLLQKRQKYNMPAVSAPSKSEDANIWLPNSTPFSRNSIAYHSFYDTEMCGNSFSHVPSMLMDDSYVYDPNKRPKSSILKVRRKGETSLNEAKSNGTKHWSLGRHTSLAMSPTDSVSSLNSVRSITFSDMVDVEHTPVKICLVSGKPQTPMDDFKMLLQQHSGSRRGQSACSALNVQPRPHRVQNNAQLLYSGSMSTSNKQEAPKQGSAPSRTIVTLKDLRTAMANPATNSVTGDLGLPYEELQAQNRNMRSSPATSPSGSLSRQDQGVKFKLDFSDAVSDGDSSKASSGPTRLSNGDLSVVPCADKLANPEANREQKRSAAKTAPDSPHERPKNESMSNSSGMLCTAEASNNVNSNNSVDSQASTSKKVTKPSELKSKTPPPKNGPGILNTKPRHLTESASDSVLSRNDLMEDIRRRGARRDSRQEAVSELETSQEHRKLSASSMPSLTTAGKSGLGSLLDSMKTALKSMAVVHSVVDGENEHDGAAWE
ncbi:LOW QUALITY PROTEIN: uncharacterized protein [Asterias amurensis]|uniref:LOW QUALITY PROTEIN: uncharacterized protein n=1 Tax=Asterias amurensis TaxID=7602 RepID=UPI003AB1C51E